jgi:hypothetical protein
MRKLMIATVLASAVWTPAFAGDGALPSVHPAPPPYGYTPPRVYRHPPGVIAAPEGPAYVVPGPAYHAGSEYEMMPIGIDARRYYRECQWEWGYRRCHVWSKYFFW